MKSSLTLEIGDGGLPENFEAVAQEVVARASNFASDPDSEPYLKFILWLNEKSAEMLSEVKSRIEANAVAQDPNFSAVRGSEVAVEYRAYGSAYKLSKDFSEDDFNPTVVSRKTSYSINTKAVESYEEEFGELPSGIVKNERKKTITIKKI